MPILRIVHRHADRATYEAVHRRLDLDCVHPLGLIMHGASEVDGRMQVAEIWESEQHARSFDEEQLEPALEALGAPTDADVEVFELHHLVTP